MFEVTVDGVTYWLLENKDARVFKNIKVFASDDFYNPAAGKIRNMKIRNIDNTHSVFDRKGKVHFSLF